MKWSDRIVRLSVGGLFIFSGLVKLNDPIGTQIKMEEYFEVFATDFAHFFEHFIPWALPISLFLIILEIVLGVAVLLNFRMKWTTLVLSALILFFTFLTFYSAYFNKVTDCGCFGDAIPLTPWESFWKDLVLVLMIGYLVYRKGQLHDWLAQRTALIVLSITTLVCLFVGIYAIRHLPFIDFRPYAVGDNIPANMVAPEQPIFEYTFEKEGVLVKSTSYLSKKDGYSYVSHMIKNADKTIPKITDYNIWNEQDGDYTQQSLEGVKLFLISYNVSEASKKQMEKISNLTTELQQSMDVIALTSSSGEDFENFEGKYHLDIPYYYGDATVLKAMIRSNPGLMLLRDGNVLGKWHYNDVPRAAMIHKLLGQ